MYTRNPSLVLFSKSVCSLRSNYTRRVLDLGAYHVQEYFQHFNLLEDDRFDPPPRVRRPPLHEHNVGEAASSFLDDFALSAKTIEDLQEQRLCRALIPRFILFEDS